MTEPRKDRYKVERDGEELEVFNHVTVPQEHYVNAVNGYETHNGPINAGNGGIGIPEAVTERVATLLRDEFGIDPEDRGIEVVDINAADTL